MSYIRTLKWLEFEVVMDFSFPYRSAGNVPISDHRYLFLKKLCQILAALGTQLCALWVSIINSKYIP